MNDSATKKNKRLSEELLETQSVLQDVARGLQRAFAVLIAAQKLLQQDDSPQMSLF